MYSDATITRPLALIAFSFFSAIMHLLACDISKFNLNVHMEFISTTQFIDKYPEKSQSHSGKFQRF